MNNLHSSPRTGRKPYSVAKRAVTFITAAKKFSAPLLEIASEGLSGKYSLSHSQEVAYARRAATRFSTNNLCGTFAALESADSQKTIADALYRRFVDLNSTVRINKRNSVRPPPPCSKTEASNLQKQLAETAFASAMDLRELVMELIIDNTIHSVPAIDSLLRIYRHFRAFDSDRCDTTDRLPVQLAALLASENVEADQKKKLIKSIEDAACLHCRAILRTPALSKYQRFSSHPPPAA